MHQSREKFWGQRAALRGSQRNAVSGSRLPKMGERELGCGGRTLTRQRVSFRLCVVSLETVLCPWAPGAQDPIPSSHAAAQARAAPCPEERGRPSPVPHVPSAAHPLSFTLAILGAVFPFWRKTQDACDLGPQRSLRVRSQLWAQSPEHRTRAPVHPSRARVTFTDGAEGPDPREDSPKGGPSCLCQEDRQNEIVSILQPFVN